MDTPTEEATDDTDPHEPMQTMTAASRVVTVMTSDEVHLLGRVLNFQANAHGPSLYMVVARCGAEVPGPLHSTAPDSVTCPTCRDWLTR